MIKQNKKKESEESSKSKEDLVFFRKKPFYILLTLFLTYTTVYIVDRFFKANIIREKNIMIQELVEEVSIKNKMLYAISDDKKRETNLERILEQDYNTNIVGQDTLVNLILFENNLEKIFSYFPNMRKVVEKNLEYLFLFQDEYFPRPEGGRLENFNMIATTLEDTTLAHELFHLYHYSLEDEREQLESEWKQVAGEVYDEEYFTILPKNGLIRPIRGNNLREDIAYTGTDLYLLLEILDKNPDARPPKIDENVLKYIAKLKISNYLFIDSKDERYVKRLELLEKCGAISPKSCERAKQFIDKLKDYRN
ncbi:hypothetical protein KY348_07645 [Candidatus Woesearchaeota archaeon]|nr:hypothetical protein [Candidatus Woesearchaeota archaeon]